MFFTLARHAGLWFGADALRGRASGGHVNPVRVRKDIILTLVQNKQALTLARLHVNSAGTWRCSVSLPCKVCGEPEEEEGGLHGQIDGDSSGEGGGGWTWKSVPLLHQIKGPPCLFQ